MVGTLADLLSIPAGVTIEHFDTNPPASLITPAPGINGAFTGPVDVTVIWEFVHLPPETGSIFTISFDIVDAPPEGEAIINERAVLTAGETIVTTADSCEIPVSGQQPPRGVRFQDLERLIL